MEMKPSRLLDNAALKYTFINQLNTVYRVKSHLSNQLSELKSLATFSNLKFALEEEIHDVKNQLTRLEQIFNLLDTAPSGTNCLGIDAIIREAFDNIKPNAITDFQSDLALTFYMSIIEHIEVGGFRMLNLTSKCLQSVQIEQLLLESFDEAKDSARLFTMIAKEYIAVGD